MRSLDVVDKLGEGLHSSKQMIETKVGGLKTKTYEVAEAGMHKIGETIVPIDQYLAGSLLAAPLNIAVGVAEKVVDRILPEEAAKEQGQPGEQQLAIQPVAGPIIKATRISQRLQKEAFSKMNNLRLRSPETINAMKVVDLLNYAAENLDNAVKSTKTHGSNKINEVRTKVRQTTSDVVGTLNSVADMMSKQLSGPYETMRDKTKQWVHLENEQDIHTFTDIAQKSAARLREAGTNMLQSVSAEETLPGHWIHNIRNTVNGVLENLSVLFVKHKDQQQ